MVLGYLLGYLFLALHSAFGLLLLVVSLVREAFRVRANESFLELFLGIILYGVAGVVALMTLFLIYIATFGL